jgi:Uma2 family endonuclease
MVTRTRHRLTVEEFLALPPQKPNVELIHGEAVPKIMGDRKHMRLQRELAFALTLYIRTHGGDGGPEGRTGTYGDPGDPLIYLPDIAWWAPGRDGGPDGLMLPPTLAIEIRSPEETMAAQRRKCRDYRAGGVDVCWLIDPVNRRAEVFEGDRDAEVLPRDGALESAFLPGFRLALVDLFAVLDA